MLGCHANAVVFDGYQLLHSQLTTDNWLSDNWPLTTANWPPDNRQLVLRLTQIPDT
jgi:hypothetical protein